mgnify:CR=1 FL=1
MYGMAHKEETEQAQSRAVSGASSMRQLPSVEINPGDIASSTQETTVARIANKDYTLEIVRSQEERIRGLSGRKRLGSNSGMLFLFPTSDYHAIWMKEMNFAIDIVWLDADYKVVNIVQEATPESYPATFRPEVPARYVIELPAGSI